MPQQPPVVEGDGEADVLRAEDDAPAPSGCTAPGAIDSGAVLAWADGEAPAAVGAHLAACPACRAETQEVLRLDRVLRAVLHRDVCPPGVARDADTVGVPTVLGGAEAGARTRTSATAYATRARISLCGQDTGPVAPPIVAQILPRRLA